MHYRTSTRYKVHRTDLNIILLKKIVDGYINGHTLKVFLLGHGCMFYFQCSLNPHTPEAGQVKPFSQTLLFSLIDIREFFSAEIKRYGCQLYSDFSFTFASKKRYGFLA